MRNPLSCPFARPVALLFMLLASWLPAAAFAEGYPGAETGPAVPGYGPVFPVPEGAFALGNDRVYKVSKDVSASADDPGERNRNIEALARFLNMQARAGTAPEQLQVAMVVHGGAWKDLLTDAAYRERFGLANPNTGLLDGLAEAGVAIYLCGQTAAYRGLTPAALNPAVELSLSAMAAHVQLQSEGYTLIPF
ncbi:MAG: DsrE family protein [Pseudohaliea sp.]